MKRNSQPLKLSIRSYMYCRRLCRSFTFRLTRFQFRDSLTTIMHTTLEFRLTAIQTYDKISPFILTTRSICHVAFHKNDMATNADVSCLSILHGLCTRAYLKYSGLAWCYKSGNTQKYYFNQSHI